MRTRSGGSFNRKAASLKTQPSVLVICEDTTGNKKYLEEATYVYRIKVKVEVSHCGSTDPLSIIEAAIERASDFAHVFCVIDRDTHENFDDALKLAKQAANLDVIVSYPCFEYWYLLHFDFSRRPYSRQGKKSPGAVVVDELKSIKEMKDYTKSGKSNLFQLLIPKLEQATEYAIRGLGQAERENQMNPSTRIHELIQFFKELSSPQGVIKK